MSLDSRPARTDLTDRECAKLICGTIGCLLQMADPIEVEKAIDWVWENRAAVISTARIYAELSGGS